MVFYKAELHQIIADLKSKLKIVVHTENWWGEVHFSENVSNINLSRCHNEIINQ